MKERYFMQVKANRVVVLDEKATTTELLDVEVIKGTYGLYVEHSVVIGTDTEGKDLIQKKFQMFPWEKVLLLEWNEKTLIESVKEFVILTQLEDFTDLLEELEEELGISEEATEIPKESTETGSNPYE